MIQDFGIIQIVHWMTYIFPSLSAYAKIITPLLFVLVSVIGIFSNILPEPGHVYVVPSVEDLASELKTQGRLVYRFARISRRVTVEVNKIIVTKPYKWFYVVTTTCSKLIGRFRGVKIKSSKISITKPEHYKIDLNKRDDSSK